MLMVDDLSTLEAKPDSVGLAMGMDGDIGEEGTSGIHNACNTRARMKQVACMHASLGPTSSVPILSTQIGTLLYSPCRCIILQYSY